MGAPMVIKWTDGGAPTLSRVASSLIDILDYCLPQKGWTKVFSGTDKAVYRAGSGVRKFFRVLNDNSFYYYSSSYEFCHAMITAYDAMTDVDTGTGQWGQAYFNLSHTSTPVPRPWMCIFNETTFFFVSLPNQTTGLNMDVSKSILQGFGDTIPALPGNTTRCFLAGNSLHYAYTNTCSIVCPLGDGSASYVSKIRCDRSLDGSRTGIYCTMINNGGQSGMDDGTAYPFGRSSTALYAYPYNGELLYARPMLNDGLDFSMGDYIPGLYNPCHQGNTLVNWGEYTADAKTLLAFLTVSANGTSHLTTTTSDIGAMLISLEGEDWT